MPALLHQSLVSTAKKARKQFSKEVRANIVKLVIDGGRTCPDVAKEFNIPTANVYGWVRQARVDAGDVQSRSGTTSDRAEIARLKRALKTREQELAFLKKTAIYFATLKKRDSPQ